MLSTSVREVTEALDRVFAEVQELSDELVRVVAARDRAEAVCKALGQAGDIRLDPAKCSKCGATHHILGHATDPKAPLLCYRCAGEAARVAKLRDRIKPGTPIAISGPGVTAHAGLVINYPHGDAVDYRVSNGGYGTINIANVIILVPEQQEGE